jgi:predicted AAA+ superfamily ATPase
MGWDSAHLGRELGVSPPTARRWLSLLEGSFQWFEVPAFSKNVVKRATGRGRGHIADSGFACAMQLLASPATLDFWPGRGALFESAVIADIRAQCALISPRPNLWHWRLHSGAEIDLLLEWSGQLYPFEIKLQSHPGKHDARGFRAFRDAYPKERVAPGVIIAPTEGVTVLGDDAYVMPWDSVPARSGFG